MNWNNVNLNADGVLDFSMAKGVESIIQLVLQIADVQIELIDEDTLELSGVSSQVQLASALIETAIIQAKTAKLEGSEDFDLKFISELDEFLNNHEPAANNFFGEDEFVNSTVRFEEELQLSSNAQDSEFMSSDANQLESTAVNTEVRTLNVEDLLEFFHSPSSALSNAGAAFDKPMFSSSLYYSGDDVASYKLINDRLGVNNDDNTSLVIDVVDPDQGTDFIPNIPPVAADDEVFILEGETKNFYEVLLRNDLDTDTLKIDALSDTDGLNGTISLNTEARTLYYEAGSYFDFYAAGETYTESFTYHITDGRGGEFSALVTVTVTGVNDVPIAQDDVAVIGDDTTHFNGNVFADNGNGADSDIDASDVISVSAVLGGSVGSATSGSNGGLFTINSDGSINFDPNGDFISLDTGETLDTSVVYTVDDGNGGTDTATVTITVTGVNDGPVAQDDNFATQESDAISGDVFVDNGNGVDSDADTTDGFSINEVEGLSGNVGVAVAGSTGGLFTINSDGSFDFDPNGDFEYLSLGQTVNTEVQYTIVDNSGETSTATVQVTLTGENDSFTGNDDLLGVDENVTLHNLHAIVLSNDVDIDTNDVLNITAVDTSSTNGTVTFNDATNTLTYTASNFEEYAVGETTTDTLTYTVTDGYGVTQDVTVTLSIRGVNDAPVAMNDVGTTDEDNTFSANVLADNGNGADSDIDTSDVLSVSAVSGGSVGSAVAGSTGGLFTINSDGSMLFDPNNDFEALAVGETQDTVITYTTSDGNGGTDTATVTITVTGVNDDPTGSADSISITEDEMSSNLQVSLLSNDTDVDASDVLDIISIDNSSTTGYASFSDAGDVVIYSASNFDYLREGETATDSFVYTVSDGNGGTDDVTVTVTITGANDDPTAATDAFSTDEDTVMVAGNVLADNGSGADSDADIGDTVTVSGITGGSLDVATAGSAGGLFTLSADGTINFDPNGDFESLAAGETLDTLAYYTVTDGNGGEGTGTIVVTVTGVNDGPSARDDALTTDEDTVYNGNVFASNGNGADYDPDSSDTLTVSSVTGGSLGSAIAGSDGGLFTINADGTISFDPNGEFESLAIGDTQDTTIQYTISDGNGGTDTATVTVTVTAQNDDPIAQNDQLDVVNGTIYNGNILDDNLYGADSDPDDGDVITVSGVTGGALDVAVAGSNGGLFTISADGTISFDSNGEFDHLASADSEDTTLEYTISDGKGGTDTAIITMTVTGGSLVAEDDGLYGEVAENGQTLLITSSDLTFNDITADTQTISIIGMTADPGQGSFTDNMDGTWTYTSPVDSLAFSGIANITYTAQDTAGSTDTATFQIRVFNTITGTSGDDVMVAEDNSVPHKFWGLAGNDTITGSDERDLFIGGADDDDISGGAGDDDFIFEGTGNGVDVIDGGTGTDRVIGSASDDTFTVLSFTGIEEIDMGAGTDTLAGTSGDDTFVFGSAIITNLEEIDGGAGTNVISGTSGDDNYDLSNVVTITNIDHIELGAGNDTLIGSQDDDTIHIGSGNNVISGDAGADTFVVDATVTGENIIDGGAGYDQIIGSADDSSLVLATLTSIELIDLGAGTDYMAASEDGTLDISAFTLGVDLIGLDYITDNIGAETVIGTDQDDLIVMNADTGADSFSGADGDDTFSFTGAVNGGDSVDGGIGTDSIIGSSGNDSLTLSSITSIELIDMGAGTDFMRASVDGTLDISSYTLGVDLLGLEYITDNSGAESVIGTDQDDLIVMNADTGADSFSGADGDDTFSFSGAVNGGDSVDGGVGTDNIIGSSGDDSLTLSSITSVELIDMGAGTDFMRASVDGTLDISSYTLGVDLLGLEYITDNSGTENVIGTDQDDLIVMNADTGADSFSGADGDDTFSFSGAVSGGDSVDGGVGTDSIIGSSGDDSLTLSSITSIELIDMGAGTDYMRAASGGTLDISAYTLGVDLLGLEYITDNTGAETVIGTDQDDLIVIRIDYNADSFSGMDGDDTFSFSGAVSSNDSVDGGVGTDSLIGSSGNDSLTLSTITSIELIDMGAGTDYMRAATNGTLDISAYTLGVDLLGLEYITDNSGAESVIGTDQDDLIVMNADTGADSFSGMDGDDTFSFSGSVNGGDSIDGGDGTDSIIGSSGNDTLRLSAISDIESLDFGAGNDVYVTVAGLTDGSYTIDMGSGTDYMTATAGNTLDIAAYTLGVDLLGLEYIIDNTRAETIIATNQADEIHIRDDLYTDSFYGLDGDDVFIFSGDIDRSDRIYGGDGNDQLIGSSGNDSLVLTAMDSIEYIDFGAGTDFISLSAAGTLDLSSYTIGVDLLGLEYIIDNGRAETIIATNQADEIHIRDDDYTDTFYGLDGDDVFIFSGDIDRSDRIYGGEGNDQLIGSSGNDSLLLRTMDSIEYIDLGAGTDFMRAYSGGTLDLSSYTVDVDLLGLEYIIDNSNAETIIATNQADEIRLVDDLYADTFYGMDGDDVFSFSGNIDHNDYIYGGDGTDQLIGSSGNDSLLLRVMDSIEYIDLGTGTDFMRAYSGGTLDLSSYTVGVDLLGLEYIIDNSGSETIRGTNQADEIHLENDSNSDSFYGLDGDDVFSFSGNIDQGDHIYGGDGTDQLIGSSGNNRLVLRTLDSIEFIDLGSGTDHMRAYAGGTLDISAYTLGVDLLGLEYITDNSGTETVIGTDQADEIWMRSDSNADSFYGRDGDDVFVVNGSVNGGDRIYGGDGTDSVTGSDYDDILNITVLSEVESIDLGDGDDGFIIGSSVSLTGVSVDLGIGTDYIGARVDSSIDLSSYTLGVDILGLEYITDNTGTETITGTDQADLIVMNTDTDADTFNGGDGDDVFSFDGSVNGGDRIHGGLGTDVITGSDNNDILNISALSGIDSIDFGDGDDGFVVGSSVSLSGVSVDFGLGTDYISARSDSTLDLSSYTLGVDLIGLEYITDNTCTETITGTDQADLIVMNTDTEADTFNGGDGDDVFSFDGSVNGGDRIHGGLGTDVITGSDNNDILSITALSGIDSIDFGDGNDWFIFNSSVSLSGVVVDMGLGTDYIAARYDGSLDLSSYTLGVDILGLEYITDNTGEETITGTDQADQIILRSDNQTDTFNGGDGDDVFSFDGSVNGGDRIHGGLGTDVITGSANNDVLNITALSGIDSIDFGDGDDGFIIGSSVSLTGVSVDFGIGTDYMSAREDGSLDLSSYTLGVDLIGLEYITDNIGAETITGTDQADQIVIRSDNEADTFDGGDGDDTFTLDGSVTGGDNIDGGLGTDSIIGSGNNDTLNIASLSGIESINFGAGDDGFIITTTVSLTGVSVDFGSGTDYLSIRNGGTLDLSTYTLGVDLIGLEYITDNVASETLIGTDQADLIVMRSDSNADSFSGGDGDDVFSFTGSVNGGDSIDGGLGTDSITGSDDHDILNITSLNDVESIDFGDGDDGFIIGSSVSLIGVDVDFGTGTADYIGARSGDTLDLSSYTLGVDIVGLDYITDNTGSETIMGTDQDDEIRLQADGNSDVIYGNDGSDLIMILGELTATDNLADFDATEGDVLDISEILSFSSADGDLIEDFLQFTDSGDGDPADGSGTVTLSIDVDGADNGASYQDYFVFSDQGLDLATLIANGNLVVE